MSLKVYVDLLSQPSRALVLFLRQTKIPHSLQLISLSKGEHFSEKFGEIHPFRKVPAINDDGFKMIESVAILKYLARKYNVPDHWYPKDIKMQARVDEFIEWQHISFRAPLALYFINTLVKPMLTNKPTNPERIASYKSKMDQALDELETVWLQRSSYIGGDKISIADLLGLCEIDQTTLANVDPSNGRPKVAEWLKMVRNELNPDYDYVVKMMREGVALFMKKGESKL